MTELLINGYSVILPKEFNTSIKTENPILTKNGEYSYDLVLDLKNEVNKKVFGFLNRINVQLVKKEWSAVMIVNSQVVLNGRAILVTNTEDSISIQLISGNSELNYLIGGDKMISSLDLGHVGILTAKEANKSLKSHWPESNYVIAPIYNGGRIINSYEVEFNNAEWSISNIIVQPYLGYYIEAIPKALGYEVKENALRNSKFLSMLYILNLSSSREYKDFIPGKTANQFLTEIEKFLNIVFVVDKTDKSVRILEYAGIHETFGIVSLKCLDHYKVDTDEDGDEISVNYRICEYDLPETNYHKFQNITTSILSNAEKITYSDWESLYSSVKSNLTDYYNKNIIFYAKASESYYIVDLDDENKYYLRRCHLFGKTGNGDLNEDATTQFGIVPAEIIVQKIWYRLGGDSLFGYMQYPKSSLTKNDYDSEKGIIDKIKTGEPKEPIGTKYTECALYYGGYYILNKGGSHTIAIKRYPLSINDYLLEIEPTKEMAIEIASGNKSDYTFRLDKRNGRYETLYSKNAIIDHRKKYEFSFLAKELLDPRAIYIIKNKSFICKEIEYTISASGLGNIAKGIFYPYTLQSSIGEQWILANGVWSDKGMWDDSQPWLDKSESWKWTLEEGSWNDLSLFIEDGEWKDTNQTI